MGNFNQGNNNLDSVQNFDLETFIEEETNCNGCFDFENGAAFSQGNSFIEDNGAGCFEPLNDQFGTTFSNDVYTNGCGENNCNSDSEVYTFDIRLANGTNSCHANNELLLDYVPEPYQYIPNTLKVDGRKPCNDFLNNCNGNLGYRGAIARHSAKFNARLTNNTGCTMTTMNVSTAPISSLSNIVERVGDLGLEGSFVRGNDCEDANLSMTQRVYTTERGCQQFDVFEFTIENRGKRTATCLMFEDQFPCNVVSLPDKVKLNGRNVCSSSVIRRNVNNLLINLPDLPPRGRMTLCAVCEVFCGFGQSRARTNYGKLFYVSNFESGETECPGRRSRSGAGTGAGTETIQVRECVSNTKRVCKDSRSCRSGM